MTCRPCLDTYIHTYKQTINQYKQIVIIHKSIETYSYTYTWLQMVRPPQPTHRGGAGTLCVHVVSLCADTKTMTCRPCWDTHILTYQQTDRQTHRHTYINQYKHIVIPIHGCIYVTYPPFGGGGGGGEPGGAGSYISYIWCIYAYHFQVSISFMLCEMGSTFEYCQALSCQSDDVAYPSLTYSWWYVADCCFSGRNSAPNGKYFYRWIRSIHPIESQKTIIQK